jgi:hypothetical protein
MLNARVGAACLTVATVGTLLQFAVTPVDEGDSATKQLAAAAAHLSRMKAAAWLDLTILFTVPAVLYIAALAGGWRSRLAVIGAGCAVLANLGAGYVLGVDELAAKAATSDDQAGAAALYRSYLNSGVVATLVVTYLLLGTLGFVLLGLALRRAAATPWWAWSALAASQVVQLVGSAAGVKPLAIAGYALFVLAGFACAARLLRPEDARTPSPSPVAPAAVG